MRILGTLSILPLILIGLEANAADVNKKIIVELDPIAPTTASFDETDTGNATSKWGGSVDFNVAGLISTGPELWTGTFNVTGPDSPADSVRREDFQFGERHKIDAMRFRWNLTKWEQTQSMRGWYVRAGYSYLRVNSRANRYTEVSDENDAIPFGIPVGAPDDDTDLVTDIRHGGMVGFGNRWLFVNQKLSISIGASYTGNFKRSVDIDSKDPDSRKDYDTIIEDIPDARISTRPSPEANLGLGYAW
jgi:hypothetical protein